MGKLLIPSEEFGLKIGNKQCFNKYIKICEYKRSK